MSHCPIRLSLIVATYNRAQQLLETLSSVTLQSALPETWECIVVNNNSLDNTIQSTEQFIRQNPEFNFRLITELRQGLSHARNCGIENSSAPIIAIIDDDELIAPDFISAYIDFFDAHPHVAAAGGAIIATYRSSRPRWISKYTEKPIANPLYLGDKIGRFPRGIIPGGGNMAIRRDIVERLGAFDPELGRRGAKLIGGEESNLFERLRAAGEEYWWVPRAVMYHLIPDEKLKLDYLLRLWYNIGVSHAQRAKVEGRSRAQLLITEAIKWGVSLVLYIFFLVTLRPAKGHYLLLMRYHISRGIAE